jgi:hypothetical protein
MANPSNPSREQQRGARRSGRDSNHAHVPRCWLWLLLLGVLTTQTVQAQAPCPFDPYASYERCEKLARRAQKLNEREMRRSAILNYRVQHPWRVSLLADTSFSALGLTNMYAVGFWSVGAGASVLREVAPAWTLRMDALGRFGHGRIRDYGFDYSAPIDASAGYVAGAEARVAMLWRLRAVYAGPALSLGYLHLPERTLHEADFVPDRESYTDTTLHIPANAAFFGVGVVFGGEPIPRGPYSINLHFTPGAWGDMRHLYLSAAIELSIKLWD